jgi:hypothetical protein
LLVLDGIECLLVLLILSFLCHVCDPAILSFIFCDEHTPVTLGFFFAFVLSRFPVCMPFNRLRVYPLWRIEICELLLLYQEWWSLIINNAKNREDTKYLYSAIQWENGTPQQQPELDVVVWYVTAKYDNVTTIWHRAACSTIKVQTILCLSEFVKYTNHKVSSMITPNSKFPSLMVFTHH